LRGSHGIAQLSDIVVGCERDQQGENPNLTTVRVLKNRWTGETGKACKLEYSKETGRMTEVDFGHDNDDDPYGFNKNDETSDF
jgi:twinkle protein